MTREEILEQAKVGGRALIEVNIIDCNDGTVGVDVGGLTVCPAFYQFIEIKPPPPKTDTEKLADALAEIERLNIIVKKYDAATLSYSTAFAGSEAGKCLASLHENMRKHNGPLPQKATNPWRDHDGGDMPCDGDLKVDYVLRDGYQYSATASQLRWLHRDFDHPCHINRWRPHVGVG